MTLRSPTSIHCTFTLGPEVPLYMEIDRRPLGPPSIHGTFTWGPEFSLYMVVDRDPEVPILPVSRQEALKSPTSRPMHDIIVHFTRLSRQGFYDLANHYLCFFSKHNEYCKTEA